MDHDESPPTTTPAEVIARRLNHLFATIKQANGRKHTDEEVAAYVAELTGQACSRHWVRKVRKAETPAPDLERLQAVAAFFGVSRGYLFDDREFDAVENDIRTARALKKLEVNGIHLRQLEELTPEQLRILAGLVQNLAGQNREDQAG